MQAIRVGSEWTLRLPDESIADWFARIPAGSSAPDGCSHKTVWISGGVQVEVCTNCGDMAEPACKEFHDATVEELKGEEYFPEDP